MKKESPKNKKTKIIFFFFQNSKGHKKDIEKGRKNPEKYKKSLATTLIFFTLFFVYKRGYILLENIVWKNVVYTITFLVKFSFSVAGCLK